MKIVNAVNGMRPPGIQTAVCYVWQSGQVVGGGIQDRPSLVEPSIDEFLELSQYCCRVHSDRIDQQVSGTAELAIFEKLHENVLDSVQFQCEVSNRGRVCL